MSRAGDFASDLGRRLRLDDMPVQTREQRRIEEKRQERQRASQGGSRPSGQRSHPPGSATAGPSGTYRPSGKRRKSTKEPSPPEDESVDEDEEEEGDDGPDDSDDSEGDDPRQPQDPRLEVLHQLIIYEPSQLTFDEVAGRLQRTLPEARYSNIPDLFGIGLILVARRIATKSSVSREH